MGHVSIGVGQDRVRQEAGAFSLVRDSMLKQPYPKVHQDVQRKRKTSYCRNTQMKMPSPFLWELSGLTRATSDSILHSQRTLEASSLLEGLFSLLNKGRLT